MRGESPGLLKYQVFPSKGIQRMLHKTSKLELETH